MWVFMCEHECKIFIQLLGKWIFVDLNKFNHLKSISIKAPENQLIFALKSIFISNGLHRGG